MRIRIVSSFRLTDPEATEFIWEGNVDVEAGPDEDASADATNERIFRYFNRVTEADATRLGSRAYFLPSLSAGDLIVWVGTEATHGHGRTFIVDGSGFTEVRPGMGIAA